MEGYTIVHASPTIETYLSLRNSTGLSPKRPEAAAPGLANTLFAVQVALPLSPETVIGMGRMIGDGGCFFLVVDIAVHPEHQGKGIGKMIMKELRTWIDENVPESGTVQLFADGRANELYRQYGFTELSTMAPFFSKGMELRC